MNIVAKSLVASAVALSLSGVALAEESGAFAGVELGFETIKAKQSYDGFTVLQTDSAGRVPLGIKVGYKQFLADEIGVRGYAYFGGGTTAQFENKFTSYKLDISKLSYGLGVDVMYNINVADGVDSGLFVGASLGLGDYTIEEKYIGGSDSFKKSAVEASINLGLRALMAQNHGLELSLGIPVGTTELKGTDVDGDEFKWEITNSANIKFAYIYNF